MKELTQEILKDRLVYNPETGIFTRNKTMQGGFKKGDAAGAKGNGYIQISISGKVYRAHRLAFLYMTGSWPNPCTDHINGIRDDNRWRNLREATKSQNNRNKGMQSNNKSGHIGVSWRKNTKKWTARIRVEDKYLSLGSYVNKEDAAEAYRNASLKHFGEFSGVNR